MPEQSSQTQRSSGAKWLVALLVAACLVQSFLIFRLSTQVKDLQSRVLDAESKVKARSIDPLVVGEALPTLTALGRNGQPLIPNPLDFSVDRIATVVVALGTACPLCEEKLPELSTWAKQASGNGVVIVAVQIDAMKAEELKSESPGLPVVFVKDGHKTWLRRISLVPTVFVFDRQGTLRSEHQGVLDAAGFKKIENALAEARSLWK